MATNTMPVRSNQPRGCYASLSREIKDEIWSYLLVTQFCASYTTTGGVEVFDNNIEHNLNLLCHPDRYIAHEARTAFYHNNTIRLGMSALPGFLSSSGHITRTYTSAPSRKRPALGSKKGTASTVKSAPKKRKLDNESVDGTPPGQRTGTPANAALWVKRLIVHIELCNPDNETDASSSAFCAQQLWKLLDCPELRILVLEVEKNDGPFPLSNCEEILVALKKKLGKRLRIYHDMGWSYGNPPISGDWRQDISGAYERDASDPGQAKHGE